MKLEIKYLENYNKEWGLISSEDGNSGYDVRAAIPEKVVLKAGERQVIPLGFSARINTAIEMVSTTTGISLEKERYDHFKQTQPDVDLTIQETGVKVKLGDITDTSVVYEMDPRFTEIQLRPRSGLAAKNGIIIVNTPGTIDYSYRGEIKAILLNTGKEDFEINPGDRIAQMVVCPIFKPVPVEVETLDETTRGADGFGSSGVK